MIIYSEGYALRMEPYATKSVNYMNDQGSMKSEVSPLPNPNR